MHDVLRSMYVDAYDGDGYGDALTLLHATADALHVSGAPVPAEWECRPGAVLDGLNMTDLAAYGQYPDNAIAAAWLDGRLIAADLIEAGTVLTRYLDVLQRAGRDY